MISKNGWKKFSAAAPWVLALALGVADLLLLRENVRMRGLLEDSRPQILKAGDRAPSFSARGLRGERLDVSYTGSGPKRVLLYFTPSCPFCREQFAHWREVIGRVDRENFEIVGLVSDAEDKPGLEEYLRAVGCGPDSPTPLRVALVPDAVRRSYKLSATPITLLVSSDGTVEEAWSGRWDGAALSDVGPAFGFNFPQAR